MLRQLASDTGLSIIEARATPQSPQQPSPQNINQFVSPQSTSQYQSPQQPWQLFGPGFGSGTQFYDMAGSDRAGYGYGVAISDYCTMNTYERVKKRQMFHQIGHMSGS